MKIKKQWMWVVCLMLCALCTGCKSSTPALQEALKASAETESSDADSAIGTSNEDEAQYAEDFAKTNETLCVFVCGEVNAPGVYYFEAGARKVDAITAAGGFTENANQSYINLAELLTDELQLYIPAIGESVAATEYEDAHAGQININTATLEELCTLSGIGESKASAIIQYREKNGAFSSVDELTCVSGIGDSTLEKIKDSIYVD